MSDGSVRGRFTIVNAKGLHARAATKLVQLAGKYTCEVTAAGPDGQWVNAKSVMGLLLLCSGAGSEIDIKAHGEGSEEAVRAIGRLIADRFGEPE